MAPFTSAQRTVAIYPWFKVAQSLLFWQSIWFLYIQQALSPAQALLLYAIFDVSTTVLEVPSGYMSDRLGRRITLILAAAAGAVSAGLQASVPEFWAFALAQLFLGASMAFASGTDSAILYESLAADGRAQDVEVHEVKAWRFTFAALAFSAVVGGALALGDMTWAYWASALSFLAMLGCAWAFSEPPSDQKQLSEGMRFGQFAACFRVPVLLWIFAVSALMYAYSHIPFVFGQPYIETALGDTALASDVPVVSGLVTAAMMGLSLLASAFAPGLRQRIGLMSIVLLAFAMQVLLAGALALTDTALAIGLLLLRMVPDALSTPFIRAHVQPLLPDATRATFLSLKSLAGRLFFSVTLALAALATGDADKMSFPEIQAILMAYAAFGLVCLAGLALWARRLGAFGP